MCKQLNDLFLNRLSIRGSVRIQKKKVGWTGPDPGPDIVFHFGPGQNFKLFFELGQAAQRSEKCGQCRPLV